LKRESQETGDARSGRYSLDDGSHQTWRKLMKKSIDPITLRIALNRLTLHGLQRCTKESTAYQV
jgi:hypothetical protein